jgi:uncharacterized membrane protein YfcA
MFFPIAGVTLNAIAFAGIGLLVGILGGFFGVGGGFIAGPLMFLAGVPMNFVVGTELAQLTGKSIVASKRHRVMGHVDIKLGLTMMTGTIIGVEVGAQVIERLKVIDAVESVIGSSYVAILVFISAFTAWESIRAIRMIRTEHLDAEEALGFKGASRRIRIFNLPPKVSFPVSGITSVSIWAVLGVAFLTGVLSGALGVGGGFIRMPLLIYVLGVPTHVAVGTDLFEIMISAGYGAVSHALKGNVDFILALLMQTGAALGAQIGARSTRYFSGPRIRLLFSALPLIGAILVTLRLLGWGI